MLRIRALLPLIALISPVANGSVRSVELTSAQEIRAPRWMYNPKDRVKGGPVVHSLAIMKKNELAGNFKACLKQARAVRKKAKSLQPWIALLQIRCAQALSLKEKNMTELEAIWRDVDRHSSWTSGGPWAGLLRTRYIDSLLRLVEFKMARNRNVAWDLIAVADGRREWMDPSQSAELYRLAGELAFIQQNLLLAQNFFFRSLNEKESAEVRVRAESIGEKLLGKKAPSAATPPTKISYEISDDEKKLYARMETSLQAGNWLSLVQDGVQILQQFPGGQRASWVSDRIDEVYLKLQEKSDEEFLLLKEKIVAQMLKCDADRLFEWSQSAADKNFYAAAVLMAEAALKKQQGSVDSIKTLRLLARSALYQGDYLAAARHYERLVEQSSGTSTGEEALFQLGLIQFRLAKYAKATIYFEKLLAINPQSQFDLSARYWLWRTMQKSANAKSIDWAHDLVHRYPLTYYGLRARAELNGSKLAWPEKLEAPLKIELWLTKTESLSWERLNLLLQAGWFEEARYELETLAPPQSAEEKIIHARWWAAAFGYHRAIDLLSQAFEQRPDLVVMPIIKIGFPFEFSNFIEKESGTRGVASTLVRALTRQESSFRAEAISSSNALGLMQLMPATAKGIAQDLKMAPPIIPDDIFVPATNIKLGTFYLRQMIRAFDGHLPMALAAYNVGIGRLRRWLAARPDLKKQALSHRTDLLSELWIDEMPWAETSFYVKAVLRNYLIYQMLEQGEASLPSPVWKQNASLDARLNLRTIVATQ